MKQLAFTLMLLVIVLSPLAAVCQRSHGKGDWAAVQILPRGEALDVKQIDGRSDACVFAGATAEALFCDAGSMSGDGEFNIPRTAVQQIRHARRGVNLSKIVGVSTIVGVVAGIAIPPQKGGSRLLDGVGGGFAGALGGCIITAAAAPVALLPGSVIYQQPKRGRNVSAAAKAPGKDGPQ